MLNGTIYLFASSTLNTFLCVMLLCMKNIITSDQKILHLSHCALCYIIDPNTKVPGIFFHRNRQII